MERTDMAKNSGSQEEARDSQKMALACRLAR